MLGLMESEYPDFSIEEKLNAFVALIDLLRVGSSIKMEVSLLFFLIAPLCISL